MKRTGKILFSMAAAGAAISAAAFYGKKAYCQTRKTRTGYRTE